MSKLKTFIASILPGIFLIGYNVGTGSITSMSKAGANFGLDLLWAVFISCIITYYLITTFSRFTMVSGITIIQGIKQHIHPSVAIVLIASFSAIIITALIGVLGIVSEVLKVWIETVFEFSLPVGLYAFVVGFSLLLFLWIGNCPLFEKVLAIFVAIMGIAFISIMFMNFPSANELLKGFVPSIPDTAEGSDNSPFIIVAGMVGTTVSAILFIVRSQMIKETGWTIADSKIQKRDALISAGMMFLISAAVLITAASTLKNSGLKMNNVVEMIPLLEPLAGPAALLVFVIGIVAAGLSSHLPNLLVIPWLIMDYNNKGRDTQNRNSRIILLILTVISIAGVMLGFKPVFIMMLSQASIAIVLPITIVSLIYLSNKKSLMNDFKSKWYDNIVLALILAFSLYMSSLGIRGLIVDFSSL